MTTRQRKSRNELDLSTKVEVLKLLKLGKSLRHIGSIYSCSPGQILNIAKKRQEIEEALEQNMSKKKKRLTITHNETHDINSLVWRYFCHVRSRNLPITGTLLKEKAIFFAEALGLEDFRASDGWLGNFKQRHNIKIQAICGQSMSVSPTTVADWQERLPAICENYELKDIFNADESGLNWKTLMNKTLAVRGTNVHGTKECTSKARITVLFACSMLGEKLKPLVIGKSENPRCFNHKNKSRFPVTYRHQDSSWMSEKLFDEWLYKLNDTMANQKRKILLFIDHAPVHIIKSPLSNVEVVFYPPNCTSVLQPLDQGVIRSFKAYYRTLLLRRMILDMECIKPPELTLLDAIGWIGLAWDKISAECIQNCFIKAGYGSREAIEAMALLDEQKRQQESELQVLLDQYKDLNASEYVNASSVLDFDNVYPAFETILDQNEEQALLESYVAESEAARQLPVEESAESAAESAENESVYSSSELLKVLDRLKFTLSVRSPNCVPLVQTIENTLIEDLVSKKVQAKLTSFFPDVRQ